jgi:hypothetical protein
MKKVEILRCEFEKAPEALEKGVAIAHSELEMDGVAQRFEFTFELF